MGRSYFNQGKVVYSVLLTHGSHEIFPLPRSGQPRLRTNESALGDWNAVQLPGVTDR